MTHNWVQLGLIVLGALLVWEVLERLFLGSLMDSVLPANYEVAV